jgi:hypothetical protein
MVLIRSHSALFNTVTPQSIPLLIPTSFFYTAPHSNLSSWSSFHRVAPHSILKLLISLYWTFFYPGAPYPILMALIPSPYSSFHIAAHQFIFVLLFLIISFAQPPILMFLIQSFCSSLYHNISLVPQSLLLFLISSYCSSFYSQYCSSSRRFLFI